MSITKILASKEASDEDKLKSIAEIIAGVRESYGNADVEILPVKVNTPHGFLPFINLEDDSKIEVLKNQAMAIKAAAITFVEENQGTVLNKRVQELLAINPFFANVSAGTQFELL